MKLNKLLMIAGVFFVGIAIFVAMNMGETSPVLMAGQIEIAPELKDKISPGEKTLFISLLSSTSPMPLGAMRETIRVDQKFLDQGMKFLLTKEKMMLMGAGEHPLNPGMNVKVKARIDFDGQGGMDTPGDFVGVKENIALGTKDLIITINQAL